MKRKFYLQIDIVILVLEYAFDLLILDDLFVGELLSITKKKENIVYSIDMFLLQYFFVVYFHLQDVLIVAD